MLARVLITLLFTIILQACSSEPENTTNNRVMQGSEPVRVEAAPALEELECVFDTNTYQFTTQALLKYNPTQSYFWDKEQQAAVVPLLNGDTLILHIGGCSHFSYLASYRTDSAKFTQTEYLLEKAKWLAQTYFDNGFDKKYAHFIANKQYQLEESEPNIKLYSILDSDTTLTNSVYEGFYFKRVGERTEIWIHGYLN